MLDLAIDSVPLGRAERHAAAPPVRARFRDAGDAVASLGAEWDVLARAAAEPNAYAESWFVAASLPAFASGEVRLVEVRRGLRLIGLLPVTVERDYGRTRFRYVQNWRHDQMFLGTPLVRAGEEAAFWAAALDLLDGAGWAANLLHVAGLVEDGPVHCGLADAAAASGRRCAVVHHTSRALLESRLGPDAFIERHIRPKKRKEIRRLRSRLAEQGPLVARRLDAAADFPDWCDSYLRLERSGWKGRSGTALTCDPAGEAFFRAALAGAWHAGRLDFLRLDLGGRPIAMLVNFLAPPGGFAFKTVFDEGFARFSPGVLIQLENLALLERGDIRWVDSCAVEGHPMIDSLWPGRRSIVRVTVQLKGFRRSAVYAACRALEIGSRSVRALKRKAA